MVTKRKKDKALDMRKARVAQLVLYKSKTFLDIFFHLGRGFWIGDPCGYEKSLRLAC